MEGESRTNVPRTDCSGLDLEGTTSDVQPWVALPLSSPTRSGLQTQTPKGGAAAGLMVEALPDGTPLLASGADWQCPGP